MHQREIAGFMKALAPVIGEFVLQAMEPLKAECKRLSDELAGLKAAADQPLPVLPDAAAVAGMVESAVAKGLAAIDVPQGPDMAMVALMIGEKVEAAVAELPPAKDGEPGASVTVEELLPSIEDAVQRHVAALPKPQDGKDGPTVDDLRPVMAELVQVGIAELPKQPVKHMVDEAGNLVAVYADGETRQIGLVRGKDGLRGASVMDGHVDEAGVLHLRMSDNRDIQVGQVRGKDGEPGRSIEGPRGRDAIEIQILPGIDEARSYPEGVCARWRGGVIRSERQTQAVVDGDIAAAGWSVMLEGIAEETEEVVDEGRHLERRTFYTSGRSFVRKVRSASVLDRGVWREGAFEKGDGVTYAGSFFIAQRDTQSSDKPGQSDAWRLAVKRGRDGQNGKLIDNTPRTVKL